MVVKIKDIKKILFYILFFFSVDTVVFGTNINRTLLYIPRLAGIIFVIFLPIVCSGKYRKLGKETIVLIFFVTVICISAIVNKEEITTVVSRIITIMVAYCVSQYYDLNEFIELFLKFMYVVSISAILLEMLYYITPGIIYALPTVTNTAGLSFKTIILSSIEI